METKTNCLELREKAKVISISLRNVRDTIKSDNSEIRDLRLFELKMLDIQDKIRNLRLQSKLNLQVLKKDEKVLREELDYYNQKLLEWSTNVKNKPTKEKVVHLNVKIKIPEKQPAQEELCEEVKEFIDFVTIHGHDDGWIDRDHQVFLKYRRKYKDIDRMIEKLRAIMPDLSEGEIKKHNKWYEKYSELQNRKKEAIKRWHESMKNNKEEQEGTKKNQEVKQKNTVQIKNDSEMEEKLKKWKEDKALKMKKQLENAAILKAITKQKEEREKGKQEEMKTMIDEWKRRKKVNRELQILERNVSESRNKEFKKREARKLIKQFQRRDIIYIRRMQNARKKPEPLIEDKRMSSIKAPSKLFEPTEQWLNRINNRQEVVKTNFQVDNFIRYIPKLHVPQWRKDVPQ